MNVAWPFGGNAANADGSKKDTPPVEIEIGDKLKASAGFLVVMAGCFVAWVFGATFTILGVSTGVDISGWSVWQVWALMRTYSWIWWLLPIGVSVIEVVFRPALKQLFTPWLAFFGPVSVVDLGTTSYGISKLIKGAHWTIFNGVDIPLMGPGLYAPSMGIAALLTFLPEMFFFKALCDLLLLWGIKKIRLFVFTITIGT